MKKHLTGLIALFMVITMVFSVLPVFAASYTIGDVDNDGKISADDARLALRAAISLENYASGSAQALACDADNDGKITTSDARLILRAAVGLEKLHQHNYTIETITKNPTCTENGEKTIACSCGDKITESIPATGIHTWDAGKITKAATCKDTGIKTYTCTSCGTTKTETVAKTTVHTWDSGKITKTATCTADGVKTFTCSVCGTTKTEVIEKTGTHTYDAGKITKAATCAAEGVKTFTCTVCGAAKTEAVAKNAANHTGKTVTKNAVTAGCTTTGYTGDVCCADCGAVLTKGNETAAAGHKYQTVTEDSCYEEGVTYEKCSVCGDETEHTTIPPTGKHNVQLVNEPASCTSAGYTIRKCVNGDCSYYETESYVEGAPATGHSFPLTPTSVVAPTCTKEGYSVYQCPVCEAIEQRDPVPATGHKPGAYTITTTATCTDDGVKTAKCTVCNETVTATIPATGHNVEKKKYATECELRMECSNCGKVFSTMEYHTWGRAKTLVAASCTQEGKEEQTCRYCGTVKENTVAMKEHSLDSETKLVPATCTTDGSITYGGGLCKTCNQTIEPGTVVLPAKGHTPGAKATCTTAQTCDECGATLVAALGHDYKNENNVLGAELNGFYCNRCGQRSTNKTELINTFNSLVNNIKSYKFYNVNNRTATLLGKSTMATTYSKFDFGIYTNMVKGLYDDEMAADEETYDRPRKTSLNFMFQVAYQNYVSRLGADDLDGITVERLNGIDGATILNGYADTYTVGSTTVNTTPYKQTKINGNVIKVTIDVKDEIMTPGGSNVPSDRMVPTGISKIYNYDIREERDLYDENWKLVEEEKGDGYNISMTMNLEKITADAKVIFYFDEATYNPIAAVYDIDTAMNQNVNMAFRIGVFSLDGVIKPNITTKTSSVYLFSDYFTPIQ